MHRVIFFIPLIVCMLHPASATDFIKPELTSHDAIELDGGSEGRIEYLRIKDDRSIELRNVTGYVIYASEVRSIRLQNCRNIRIENCFIRDSNHNGIELEGCENITIQGNRIERVSSGLYALDSTKIQFVGNYVEDVQGPMPRGQMVQFNKVNGPGSRIVCNHAVAHEGRSSPEDLISIYQSSGTEEEPILIEGNHLHGDPESGSQGKSGSGSGIMLGDSGGEHIICRKNFLSSPGQVGIGVAGGGDIVVEENLVVGTASHVSNVGIYAWNQSGNPGGKVVVRNNRVSWINKGGNSNGWWKGDGFSEVIEEDNQWDDRSLEIPPPPLPAPLPPTPVKREDKVELPWKIIAS